MAELDQIAPATPPDAASDDPSIITVSNNTSPEQQAEKLLRHPGSLAIPIDHMLSLPRPDSKWLVKPLLGDDELVMLTAEPGAGKSWLVSHLACSVTTGRKFLDHFDVAGRSQVILIDEEQSLLEVWRRLERLCNAYAYKPGDLNRFRYFSRPKLNIDRDPKGFAKFVDDRRDELILGHKEDDGPGLIIIDSLTRIHRTSENDAIQMAEMLENLRSVAKRLASSLLFVHHTRKTMQDLRGKKVEPDPSHAFRGTSDLRAFVDQHWFLQRIDNRRARFVHDKHRTGPQPHPDFDILIEDVNVGAPNEGTLLKMEKPQQASGHLAGNSPLFEACKPIIEAGVIQGKNGREIVADITIAGIKVSDGQVYRWIRLVKRGEKE